MIQLTQQIKKAMSAQPEKTAYITASASISYGELSARVQQLAQALRCQGSSPVILYGNKSVEMYVALLACLFAGRAYVPISAGTPAERLEKIKSLSRCGLIIAAAENSPPGSLSEAELIAGQESASPVGNQNTTAYIIFTSGSTGEPKGVPISYSNLENFTLWLNSLKPLQNGEFQTVLNRAAFCFDLSVADIFFSLTNGCTLAALDDSTADSFRETLDFIKQTGAGLMVATPSFANLLLLDKGFCALQLPQLRCFYFCGERLEVSTAAKLRERFPKADIINAYGPTEATCAVCAAVIDDDMLNLEYLPVGHTDNSACQIEISGGEIVLKGKSVFGGYLGFDSAACFKQGDVNCYKTGDIGEIKNGLVYCRGRMDNQIKYMGYRIELGDIENNLLKIEGVEQAVVVARLMPDRHRVKLIKAFVTLSRALTPTEIRSRLSELLPGYMVPKTITVLEEMPLNSNGKIDRRSLSEK